MENSWGEKGGRKGFYTMNDSWFDEYMFEIAAPKDMVPKQRLETLSPVLPRRT